MKPILIWQYNSLVKELLLLQQHSQDPSCPCESGGEMCTRKHLLTIEALAEETATMEEDEERVVLLNTLALEAKAHRAKEEQHLCGADVDPEDLATWSRDRRKAFEELSLACGLAPPEDALVEEIAQMFKKAEPRWCHPVKETEKELGKLSRTLGTAKKRIAVIQRNLEMPMNICRGQAEMFEADTGVLDPYGSRCRDPKTGQWVYSEDCGYEPAGITTTALGMDGITRYEFEFKIVSLDRLIISHDPFTFAVNPNYPEELQPRLRERAATKVQVEKIAANLEPDAVITDFHVIDRGTPIVGPDLVVEAGNGRVMGIIKAAADHPDKYAAYKQSLRDRVHDYGLSSKDIDSIENPVLIRLRISDVDRTTFTQEANQAATIAPSAIENARVDAQKVTMGMLQELVIGENESLEDALRAPKNQAFAKRFLATLPENIQAALVDAQGYLNRDGVHRMAMAVFVSAFQGDPGLRLAEKAFESVDMDVRNTVNSIARSLGALAQAEALTRAGERDPNLSIGDDLAQTVNVYSAIKRNPALTVEKYLAQEQIFARELTPFQESILKVLDEYKKSPKKLAGIFTAYAEGVIAAPPPAQAALIPGAEITKEDLWEGAVKAPEAQPALMEVIKMFEEATFSQEMCERPSAKYQHLSTLFTESAVEAALFAAETGVPERKIDVALAQLQSGIEEIQESDKFKAFINTMAKFHNYSLGNIMLITLQRPAASRVAGYNTWLDMGRNVIRGEHGIMILAPCFPPKPKKEEEDEEELEPEPEPVYFKVVHVFDIAQTEGKELPRVEVPVITGDETGPLYQDALTFIAKQGITVSSEPKPELGPDLMGFWSKPENLIWVRPDAPQDQRTKTALHEAAHAMCEMRGAQDAEVMAESVAYVVANHFGFDTGVRSFPYVAVWSRDVKVLKANLEIIRKVARDMIDGIEQVAELSEIARMFAPMKLLTKEIRAKLPPLYSQENVPDPMVWVKFFTPDSNWTWYATEFDGKDTFFGWVVGFEKELGYFSLRELESARGPMGLAIERDKWFKPMPLSEVKKLHAHESGELAQGTMAAIGSAAITGIGIGAGFKVVDYLASTFSKKKLGEGSQGGEGYEPSVYATRRFDKKTYIFYKHVSSDREAMKLVTQLFDNWKVLAIATHDNDIWLPKKDAPLLINPEFLKRGGSLAEMGNDHVPAYVDVFETTIAKHYRSPEDFHEGSIRVVKPEEDILVYLGCLKSDEWDAEAVSCSPGPTVLKTIVPNNKKYLEELQHFNLVHPEVKINFQAVEAAAEPVLSKEDQEELAAVEKALESAEEVA